MSDWMNKSLMPNLAKIICAFALLLAVGILGWIARTVAHDQAPGIVHRQGDTSAAVDNLGADRRLIRFAKRDNNSIVCTEGPRQLQYVIPESGDKAGLQRPALATLSTYYLREAGWQLCNAYANGVIDKAQYISLLSSLVQPAPNKIVAERVRRPTRRRHHMIR